MDIDSAIKTAEKTLFPNYRQYPIVIERGKDCRVWDTNGNEYVDFVAGIATCNLGHCHPAVTAAIREQAKKVIHVSNWYFNSPQIDLSRRLTGLTSMDRVFFCNSGAEAAETAIKTARKWAYDEYGPGRHTVISLLGAFHGRTMKALTATDPKHHHAAFSPYPEGFVHIRPGDLAALVEHIPNSCAFLMEIIQGEGGVYPIDPDFIREAERVCREGGVLMIIDEVQTGMGRCGSLLASELTGITPDIVTLAKGLGNGFPIGAVLAREEVASHIGPGSHGSTFGGNPLACSAALATLNTLVSENLFDRARIMGKILRQGLEDLLCRTPVALEVRGAGLLLGLELSIKAGPIVESMMKRGYLVTAVQEKTLRFTPPLTVGEDDIRGLLANLKDVFMTMKDFPG